MKKSIILLALILTLVLTTACGNNETPQEVYVPTTEAPVVEVEPTPEPIEHVEEIIELTPMEMLEEHLGVSFTINPIEVTWRDYGWQFLELHEELDLDNFSGAFGANMLGILVENTGKGEVFIVSSPEGGQYLHINLGAPWWHVVEIELVELETVESLNWNEFQSPGITARLEETRPRFDEHFGMYHEVATENFYVRSNESNSRYLQELAVELEGSWDLLGQVFDAPSQRIIVYLFDIDDMVEASKIYPAFWPVLADIVEQSNGQVAAGNGHWGRHHIAVQAIPRGQSLSDIVIKTAIHEVVHVLQMINNIHGPVWSHEGFANFIADNTRAAVHYARNAVRNGNFFTLSEVSAMVNDILGANYGLGTALSKLIFEFVSFEFGMRYAADLHRTPGNFQGIFGLSQEEFEEQWHEWLRETYG